MQYYSLWVLYSYNSDSCCEKSVISWGAGIPKYGRICKFQDFFQLHTFQFMSPFFCRVHNLTSVSCTKNSAGVDLFPVELFTCEILSTQGKINEFQIPASRITSAY